jgi:hypothetical protein
MELERLLRNGAYDVVNDENGSKTKEFNEEDIDSLLARRSTTVKTGPTPGAVDGSKSTFSTASFVPSNNAKQGDIDYDDPGEKQVLGFRVQGSGFRV